MLPPTCFTVGIVPGYIQTWCLVFRPKSSILFSSDQRILFLLVWESFRCQKAWLVECCRNGCPSGSFSHLHRGTVELSQSDHRVLGHLLDQGPSSLIGQFGREVSSSLGGSKLLPFKNDGGHCVVGDLQCCRSVFVHFPRSVPRHNPVSELYGQFLRPHGLFFSLACTVNRGTLYRQTGVGLSKSCPINWIYHRWTPIKL